MLMGPQGILLSEEESVIAEFTVRKDTQFFFSGRTTKVWVPALDLNG